MADLVGITGLLVGIAGTGLSVFSYQQMKTAREAEKEIERKFLQYMAAQEFEKLAEAAVALAGKVVHKDWHGSRELAHETSLALAQVRGARARLLVAVEKDKLDGAAIGLSQFIESLPVVPEDAQVPEGKMQIMISKCQTLVEIASELSGRLSVESILRPEEKK